MYIESVLKVFITLYIIYNHNKIQDSVHDLCLLEVCACISMHGYIQIHPYYMFNVHFRLE